MSQDIEFSKQSAAAVTVSAPAPAFSASMTRDAPIGTLISVVLGFVLLIVQLVAMPGFNLNAYLVSAFSAIDVDIGTYAGGILSIPNMTDQNTPLVILPYIYAAFLSFPACLSWFVGGFLVALIRVRKGLDEGNLKPGWDVFWYGMVIVEIPFAVFGIMFLLLSLSPGSYLAQGFAGGVLLFFLLFFLQPTFWIGMLTSLTGSMVGSILAKKKI
jgi:hypothetical protein